jgi:hypothetical protein
MDCDWIFVNQGRSRQEVTLHEQTLPDPGDGKIHDGRGYEVVYVVTDRVTRNNPAVIAVEFPPRQPHRPQSVKSRRVDS